MYCENTCPCVLISERCFLDLPILSSLLVKAQGVRYLACIKL